MAKQVKRIDHSHLLFLCIAIGVEKVMGGASCVSGASTDT